MCSSCWPSEEEEASIVWLVFCFETGSSFFFITFPAVWKSSPSKKWNIIFKSLVPWVQCGYKPVVGAVEFTRCSRPWPTSPMALHPAFWSKWCILLTLTGLGLNFHLQAQFLWFMALILYFLFICRDVLRMGTGEMLVVLPVLLGMNF